MAKLADAADLNSADGKPSWGFDSPSRHWKSLTWAATTSALLAPASRWTKGQGALPRRSHSLPTDGEEERVRVARHETEICSVGGRRERLKERALRVRR